MGQLVVCSIIPASHHLYCSYSVERVCHRVLLVKCGPAVATGCLQCHLAQYTCECHMISSQVAQGGGTWGGGEGAINLAHMPMHGGTQANHSM